eukprot:m.269826 g.269826  ORF g.269826 m.269826 type:complete len:87 (-) comp26841_c3_seq2:491-751(-)
MVVCALRCRFYRMQLVVSPDDANSHYLFVRFGRMGESGATNLKGPWNRQEGVLNFTKQFKLKTGNAWEARLDGFVRKLGKYELLYV